MATSSLPSMANPLLRPFHLAAITLVLLALVPHASAAATSTFISLPPRASALPTGARDDAPSSATGRVLSRAPALSDRLHAPPSLQSDGGSSAPRRLLVAPAVAWGQKDQAATAPSPQAAAPLRTRPAHHARAAAQARYRHYGATLANLHCVCQPPFCFAYSDHDLLAVLYGPHTGGRWHDSVYGIVRTIEGTPPILPFSWRAFIYSGGDVCHVEIGYMNNYDSLFGFDCPAWTCERHLSTSADEALAWAISAISTPCGGRTSSAVAASPRNAIALLPLLAVPFLPPPLAAAVALSSLAFLVLAADLSAEEHIKVNHATCSVYHYDNTTGAIERVRPFAGLRVVCPRPLCIDADANADYDERTLWMAYAQRSHGRRDDPLRVYCTVHSLEGAASPSIFFPWRNTWRTHLPVRVADIGATASSGDHVCYVELAHMDYREGYYIRCPATSDGYAHVSCTEFPEEPVASAVWEHRLTYRDIVGPKCERCKFGASGQFWGHDYNADL